MKRTLVFPENLESSLVAIEAETHRSDEFLEGAKWILERDAELGRQVWQDPPIYVLAMEAARDQPRLSLFYTIAYDKVLLLSLSMGNAPPLASAALDRGAPGTKFIGGC